MGYAIGRVFSQITFGQLSYSYMTYKSLNPNPMSEIGQWHPTSSIVLQEDDIGRDLIQDLLLAIAEIFKTWRQYLEDCRYKILVFTDDNKLY